MSRWRSVWLVAKREILERGRSRGFLFSVAFTTLLVIGSFVVPTLLFGDKDTKTIGVVQPAPPDLDTALTATAGRVDQKISVVPYDDAGAAQAALSEGHDAAKLLAERVVHDRQDRAPDRQPDRDQQQAEPVRAQDVHEIRAIHRATGVTTSSA